MSVVQRGTGARRIGRASGAVWLGLLLAALVAGGADAVVKRAKACAPEADVLPSALTRAEAERGVQCLINRRRAKEGLAPLRRNPVLTAAASAHSAFMQDNGCFDHLCPGEDALDIRLTLAGYIDANFPLWRYGEAIAWATGKGGAPRGIVLRLMGSPPHRELLLAPNYEEIGVGFRYGTFRSPAEDGGLYTVELGRRVLSD